VPAATEYPPARQAWYCVFALALAVMVNFLDRGILTLLVEPIKRDLQLTDVQMSLIMGFAFTLFYAVLVHDGNVRVVVLSTLISVPFGIAGPLMPGPGSPSDASSSRR